MSTVGRRPTEPKELVRAVDRISFLYLDRCVVNRDSNAITATDERGTVHIPAASVGALLLSPGTTITHQAIVLMADSGSTVVRGADVVFPADAGMIRSFGARAKCAACAPRRRGDDPGVGFGKVYGGGCSPQARG